MLTSSGLLQKRQQPERTLLNQSMLPSRHLIDHPVGRCCWDSSCEACLNDPEINDELLNDEITTEDDNEWHIGIDTLYKIRQESIRAPRACQHLFNVTTGEFQKTLRNGAMQLPDNCQSSVVTVLVLPHIATFAAKLFMCSRTKTNRVSTSPSKLSILICPAAKQAVLKPANFSSQLTQHLYHTLLVITKQKMRICQTCKRA